MGSRQITTTRHGNCADTHAVCGNHAKDGGRLNPHARAMQNARCPFVGAKDVVANAECAGRVCGWAGGAEQGCDERVGVRMPARSIVYIGSCLISISALSRWPPASEHASLTWWRRDRTREASPACANGGAYMMRNGGSRELCSRICTYACACTCVRRVVSKRVKCLLLIESSQPTSLRLHIIPQAITGKDNGIIGCVLAGGVGMAVRVHCGQFGTVASANGW